MEIKKKKSCSKIVAIVLMIVTGIIGLTCCLDQSTYDSEEEVELDSALVTEKYSTNIDVSEENTYTVQEVIDVSYKTERHGIYRNIPTRGYIDSYDEKGDTSKVLYYANLSLQHTNVTCEEDDSDGVYVLQFGDEDILVQDGHYDFTYDVSPKTMDGYYDFNYTVFPSGWQSDIPKKSTFSIQFPKKIDQDLLSLYLFHNGEKTKASEYFDITWDNNKVTGVLKKTLPYGTGVFCYVDVPDDYFTNVGIIIDQTIFCITIPAICALFILISYLLFGQKRKIKILEYRGFSKLDEPIKCSYLLKGSVEDEEFITMILDFAIHGYLTIQKKGKKITFIKSANLEPDATDYQLTLFNGLFGPNAEIGTEVKLKSLKNNYYRIVSIANAQLKESLKQVGLHRVFTTISVVMQWITLFICYLPIAIFVILHLEISSMLGTASLYVCFGAIGLYGSSIWLMFTKNRKYIMETKRYQNHRLASSMILMYSWLVIVLTFLWQCLSRRMFEPSIVAVVLFVLPLVTMVLVLHMRKRTRINEESIESILAFRNYMMTMQPNTTYNQDNYDYVYDYLPYAIIFGLDTVWVDKFKDVITEQPEWYRSNRNDVFYFPLFYHRMHHDMHRVQDTMISAPTSDSSGSGSFSSGSSGGFGGGGGGSW